jgi:hypothetical protein
MTTQSERMKARWQDPEYREKMLAKINSHNAQQAAKDAKKAAWTENRRRAWSNYWANRYRTDPKFREALLTLARVGQEARRQQPEPAYLRAMTPEERQYYTFLMKKKHYKKAEALQLVENERRAAQSKAAAD